MVFIYRIGVVQEWLVEIAKFELRDVHTLIL